MKHVLPDEAATVALASRVAALLPDRLHGLTIVLKGELGAGKSTFARAVLRALGHEGPAPSPTYTLIEPYSVPRGEVFHIDLYRVASEDELYFLGFDELDEGLRLIEWPERAPRLLGSADLLLEFRYTDSGREADVTALNPRMDYLVDQLESNPNT